MLTEKQWEELAIDHEIKLLRVDICISSLESCSLDEKRRICEDVTASAARIDAALKKDFASMSPIAQARMLDLLQQANPNDLDWWLDTLIGLMPSSPRETLGSE